MINRFQIPEGHQISFRCHVFRRVDVCLKGEKHLQTKTTKVILVCFLFVNKNIFCTDLQYEVKQNQTSMSLGARCPVKSFF